MSKKKYETHPEAYYTSRNLSDILKNIDLSDDKDIQITKNTSKQLEAKNATSNKNDIKKEKNALQITKNTSKKQETKNAVNTKKENVSYGFCGKETLYTLLFSGKCCFCSQTNPHMHYLCKVCTKK